MASSLNKIDVVTLGCSKNLVDSERLLSMLCRNGFTPRHDPPEGSRPAPVVVINTCGFIGDAKEESVNTILEYAQAKTEGRVRELYVMGCLSERYRNDLPSEIPEVDAWYGKFDWSDVISRLHGKHPASTPYDRLITTPSHHAYVKIAEGCNRFCAFCAIPLITGRYKSRPIEEILSEVSALVDRCERIQCHSTGSVKLWYGYLWRSDGATGTYRPYGRYPRCGVDKTALCLPCTVSDGDSRCDGAPP